jgi:hypothetical protein
MTTIEGIPGKSSKDLISFDIELKKIAGDNDHQADGRQGNCTEESTQLHMMNKHNLAKDESKVRMVCRS